MTPRTFRRQLVPTLAPTRRIVSTKPRYRAVELLPLVYAQLLDLAEARVDEFRCESVHESDSLLHEAYLRVCDSNRTFDGTPQFFFSVAQAMTDIEREERYRLASMLEGGLRNRIAQDVFECEPGPESPQADIMMVDDAIVKLHVLDPKNARVVVLRFVNGLTAEETAAALRISLATVERKWRRLKAWLQKELG